MKPTELTLWIATDADGGMDDSPHYIEVQGYATGSPHLAVAPAAITWRVSIRGEVFSHLRDPIGKIR